MYASIKVLVHVTYSRKVSREKAFEISLFCAYVYRGVVDNSQHKPEFCCFVRNFSQRIVEV